MRIVSLLFVTLAIAPELFVATSSRKYPDCSNYENGAFLPDPISCNKYYVCLNGRAIRRRCGRGLNFDSNTFLCKADTLVNCHRGNVTEEPGDCSTLPSLPEEPSITPCPPLKPAPPPPCIITSSPSTPCPPETPPSTPCPTTPPPPTPCPTAPPSPTPCPTTPPPPMPCPSTPPSPTPCPTTPPPPTPCPPTPPPSTPCPSELPPPTPCHIVPPCPPTPPPPPSCSTTSCPPPKPSVAPGEQNQKPESQPNILRNHSDCLRLKDGTFLADAKHCRRYYVCTRGVPRRLKCTRGQWFDIGVQSCRNRQDVTNCLANCN